MKTTHHLFATFILAFFIVSTATVRGEDYTYVTNNGTITITGYTGPGGNVVIPSEINGLLVTCIGPFAFYAYGTITSLTIPDGITAVDNFAFYMCSSVVAVSLPDSLVQIGTAAFRRCFSLAKLTLPPALTTIGADAFSYCTNLSSITIPINVTNIGNASFASCYGLTGINVDSRNPFFSSVDGVLFDRSKTVLRQFPSGRAGTYHFPSNITTIGGYAFYDCPTLTNAVIPQSLTEIGTFAFSECQNLIALNFAGNSPKCDETSSFYHANKLTVYYLPGTTSWSNSYAGHPTALWLLPNPTILDLGPNFGIQTNAFGFRISWATNTSVVVEASTTLANPVWPPVSTNTLVDGWSYFSDAEWTNYPARFYRVRSL